MSTEQKDGSEILRPVVQRRPSFVNLVAETIPQYSLPARFCGESTYRLTLAFLLQVACFRVFPEYSLVIQSSYGLSLRRRSYLCRLENPDTKINLTKEHLEAIRKELKWIVSMALDVESVWLSQSHLIENLEKTNQFYSARLVKTINRFQYTAMQLKIPRKGALLANSSTSSLRTDTSFSELGKEIKKGPETEERGDEEEDEDAPENEKGTEQKSEGGHAKKKNRKRSKHKNQPTSPVKRTETGLAIPGGKNKDKKSDNARSDKPKAVNQPGDMNIGADDMSFSAIPMNRDVEMQVSKHDYEFDVYYALQHRECLNNTKYCEFWELFLSEASDEENGGKSKSSISTDDKNGDSDEDNFNENFFVLAFPDKNKPKEKIQYPDTSHAIQKLYQQGAYLGKILNLQCVGDINLSIQRGRGKELILLSEAYHDKQIVRIAHQVKQAHNRGAKIVLISGPSSSGKTTFACKLAIQLKLCGLVPVGLEVDMYYKDRDDPTHPKDSKGVLNFEVIDAMRLNDLQRDIKRLLKGEEIVEPFFDLSDGHLKESRSKRKLSLKDKNSVLIMEGIFCLNPRLLGDIVQGPKTEKRDSKIPNVSAFRIFMCPIPFFSLDNLNFISEQVVRLVRRISRDNAHRGRNAEGTLFKWGMLQEGEEENMFQLIHNADVVFNSALVYEISVLNGYSKPLLQTVDCNSEQYKDANTLRSFCDSFVAMPDSDVPASSLLMEFIKTSIFATIST